MERVLMKTLVYGFLKSEWLICHNFSTLIRGIVEFIKFVWSLVYLFHRGFRVAYNSNNKIRKKIIHY